MYYTAHFHHLQFILAFRVGFFTLRAGSCTQLDEPLVISGLEPGCYAIEELLNCPNEYCTTITGPVMGNVVQLTNSCVPTVVTIVNRKRLCRRRYCGG